MTNKLGTVPETALLVGHYGGSNTGDEAMLSSLLDMLPGRLKIAVTTKAKSIEQHEGKREVHAVHATVWSVLRALLAADIVLLGGGTHFHDDYRGTRLIRHYRYMTRFVVVFAIARLLRKRVYFVGIGVGPFRHRATTVLTRLALALAHAVSVRDKASFEEAARLGAKGKTIQAFDLVAMAGGVRRPALTDQNCLAVSLTDVPGIEGNRLNRDAVLDLVGSSLEALLKTHSDIRIKIVIARGGNRESDIEVSHRLANMLAEYSERVSLVQYCPNPEDLLYELRTAGAACVMRYHAGMLAYLAGCRLLLLPYHRKLVDLGRELGLPKSACPPLPDLNVDTLTQLLSNLMTSHALFTAQLPVSEARDLARRNLAFLDT
jgi:polysaccharide pyruvyl transferase WcaK-like protein